ncbi:MAG: aldehyde ferredoxin oxidoreductase family protein [Chloroflexi bacterium]|nr:aldehyde ferredoxin oxidoreductase family protein [Chloroflexota bacterium]MBI3339452.1 aldehyde ferredoxin oxidoreductase family protein [Chloroflexota bacterium]
MQPILKVDLSTGRTEEYKIPEEWERAFLGGASLAARLLYPYLTKELDPFSPEAPLLFINGPLTGTSGPTVGRFVVCGKSPATMQWAESHCGGFWGPELRFAGYDGLWITGKAEAPVYLWIENGRFEVRPAAHLWGRDTYETQELVRQEINQKGIHVAVIGPAAENRILFAGIYCDHGRTAGRTGLGAVMASKNLKAIAVHGKNQLPLVQAGLYAGLRSESNRALKVDNEARILHELGTAGVANYAEYLGSMPAKYYHQGGFDPVDKVSGAKMAESILSGQSACHACVIACGRVVKLEDGNKRKGPEYETIVSFGPNLLIDDLVEIVRLGELCDRYGIDTISTGNTIGLAFYLFEHGRITTQDTGGLELKWGDAVAVRQLVKMTVRREGIGEWIAQGSRRFGKHFNAEEEAVQVNGLEVAYHDPRGVSGMALSYATSPRGACHNQSDYFFVDFGHTYPELGIEYFSRHAEAEKAANVARHQNWRTVYNAMVMCIFGNVAPQTQVDLINAACGYDWTIEEMMKAGERGWNMKRAVNNRMGLTADNDKLPKALLEPLTTGGTEGYVPDIQGMLRAYYEARGWDRDTGYPTREKLLALGLDDVASDLWI